MVNVQAFCAHFEYTCKGTGALVPVHKMLQQGKQCWRILKVFETPEQLDQAEARMLADAQQTPKCSIMVLAVWERSTWIRTSTF